MNVLEMYKQWRENRREIGIKNQYNRGYAFVIESYRDDTASLDSLESFIGTDYDHFDRGVEAAITFLREKDNPVSQLVNNEEDIVKLLIEKIIGEDTSRGGLHETPARVVKAYKQWFGGYAMHPKDILKVFEDGAEGADQMIMVKDIPLYSHCEHHLAAIIGTATIAYIPNGRIVGLSKLNRIVDCFARRMQVQERLTNQVADALFDNLVPLGVGVLVKARHMCMESRGICQQGHHTVTLALRGNFLDDPTVRAEFMQLAV